MKLVKVRKTKTSVRLRLNRTEKTVIKNLISLGMMIGGIGCMIAAAAQLFLCDPSKTLLAVPDMMRFGLVGMVLMFASPFVKHCIRF